MLHLEVKNAHNDDAVHLKHKNGEAEILAPGESRTIHTEGVEFTSFNSGEEKSEQEPNEDKGSEDNGEDEGADKNGEAA